MSQRKQPLSFVSDVIARPITAGFDSAKVARSRLPNFLIIGAPKCGTTSLWYYLNQHPDVFLASNKEPNYFALADERLPDGGPAEPDVIHQLIHIASITRAEDYQDLFESVGTEKAVGEASVRYLYYEKAAARIKLALPEVRLIAILREPVSRLYSHYCMNAQFQLEPLPLTEALAAEDERVQAGWGWDWHYRRVSSYAGQVRRYLSLFEPRQLKFVLYDDFVARPLETFQEICRFLEIDHGFVPNMARRGKVANRPRYLALDRWLNWPNKKRDQITSVIPRGMVRFAFKSLRRLNRGPVAKLDHAVRAELQLSFLQEIQELENLLGRKTGWIRP